MHSFIKLAKQAIEAKLLNKPLEIPPDIKAHKTTPGIFITLRRNELERGQAGIIQTTLPLFKTIPMIAKAAAFNDDKYPPVTLTDLPTLEIEITLLEEPVPYKGKITKDQALLLTTIQNTTILLPNHYEDDPIDLIYRKANIKKTEQDKLYVIKTEIYKA